MSGGLPEFLDLAHAMRQPWEQAGRIRISDLPRLCAELAADAGEIELRLQARDEGGGRVIVRGEVSAELTLACQRCLEPMPRCIVTYFRLVWVRDEHQAAAIQSMDYDPLLAPDGRVQIAELAEDELLLALPSVALHEMNECAAQPQVVRADEPDKPAQQNPFAVLEKLKQHR